MAEAVETTAVPVEQWVVAKVSEEKVKETPMFPALSVKVVKLLALVVTAVVTVAEAAEAGYVTSPEEAEEAAALVAADKVEILAVPVAGQRLPKVVVARPDITAVSAMVALMVVSAEAAALIMVPAAEDTAEAAVAGVLWPEAVVAVESVWLLCLRGGLLATLPYGCLTKAPAK